MDKTDEEGAPQQEEPACGFKSQRRQRTGRPVRPAARVDVDQQGPVSVRDRHRRHRSGRRGMERAPLIVGKWKRMVRHRIGHHSSRRPHPDSHIRDADAAQRRRATGSRTRSIVRRVVKNNTVLKDRGLIVHICQKEAGVTKPRRRGWRDRLASGSTTSWTNSRVLFLRPQSPFRCVCAPVGQRRGANPITMTSRPAGPRKW